METKDESYFKIPQEGIGFSSCGILNFLLWELRFPLEVFFQSLSGFHLDYYYSDLHMIAERYLKS